MHHLSSSRHRQQRMERKREKREREMENIPTPRPLGLCVRLPCCIPRPAINAPCEHAQPLCVLCLFFTLFSSFFRLFGKGAKWKQKLRELWVLRSSADWILWPHRELRYCCWCWCWWLCKIDCQNHCKKKVSAPIDKEALALLGLLAKSSFCCICICNRRTLSNYHGYYRI